jgi:MoxR-like ATPase
MATQNPIESEGTYALPEAQVDRFMLKILVDYPQHDEELTVIQRSLVAPPALTRLLSIEDLRAVQAGVRDIYVDPGLVSYALQLATATRRPVEFGLPDLARFISFGASPRGPISLIHAARGLAVVRGRDYVLVQDLQELAKDALRHRLVLSYEALAESRSADDILDEIVAAVAVPQLDLSGRAA